MLGQRRQKGKVASPVLSIKAICPRSQIAYQLGVWFWLNFANGLDNYLRPQATARSRSIFSQTTLRVSCLRRPIREREILPLVSFSFFKRASSILSLPDVFDSEKIRVTRRHPSRKSVLKMTLFVAR
jgi:hypothetical protein